MRETQCLKESISFKMYPVALSGVGDYSRKADLEILEQPTLAEAEILPRSLLFALCLKQPNTPVE